MKSLFKSKLLLSQISSQLRLFSSTQQKLKVLFCVPPKGSAQTENLIAQIPDAMSKYVADYKFIKDMADYDKLSAEDKRADCVVVQLGTTTANPVLKAQMAGNIHLKWVHSLSSGIDGYVSVPEFRESEIVGSV